MPIKSQKKNKGRKVQKKNRSTGKIILVSAAILCILIILSYLIFSKSSTSEQKSCFRTCSGSAE